MNRMTRFTFVQLKINFCSRCSWLIKRVVPYYYVYMTPCTCPLGKIATLPITVFFIVIGSNFPKSIYNFWVRSGFESVRVLNSTRNTQNTEILKPIKICHIHLNFCKINNNKLLIIFIKHFQTLNFTFKS